MKKMKKLLKQLMPVISIDEFCRRVLYEDLAEIGEENMTNIL